jgi:hypothetical protein
MKKRRQSGQATVVIPKRDVTEDDLLAAIRDIHLRAWLLEDDRPELAEQTIQELREAERLFYQLRAGRAITVAQAEKEGSLMAGERA